MPIDVSFFSSNGVDHRPNILVRPALLKPELVNVVQEGELVTIHFGNVPVTMHYEDAIRISTFIRIRAKEAKRLCGDVSRHWSVIGVLDGE